MPELLTKHPDVVLAVLKSQGAQCGPAQKPKILTRCPAEKFCTLQGGELCIYGPNELAQMTQLTQGEVCSGAVRKASIADGVVPGIVGAALFLAAALALVRASRSHHTTSSSR